MANDHANQRPFEGFLDLANFFIVKSLKTHLVWMNSRQIENKDRYATREVRKYNLVTRRHIKMSRQGAGAVTMAVTKADPSPATALSLPRISPF